MSTYAELTNYSKIFKSVYWGNFKAEDCNEDLQQIINNRNKFVDDMNIKKVLKSSHILEQIYRNIFGYCMDHTEYYVTYGGDIVTICSPYTNNHDDIFLKNGWVKISKLYHKNAETYIKIERGTDQRKIKKKYDHLSIKNTNS